MWKKAIIFFISVIVVAIIQISFLGRFPRIAAGFNLFIFFLVILVSLADFSWSLFFVLAIGLISDLYSNLTFGLFSLSFLLTVIFLEALLMNFFTNRSFYSFIFLGLSATIIYNAIFYGIAGSFYLVGMSDFLFGWNSVIGVLSQLVTISILLASSFFFIDSLSNKFKPNFINS